MGHARTFKADPASPGSAERVREPLQRHPRRIESRGPGPTGEIPYVIDEEDEEHAQHQADDSGDGQVQTELRPGVPLGGDRPVQDLYDREILRLVDLGLLELLGQQDDDGLSHLHLAGEPYELET